MTTKNNYITDIHKSFLSEFDNIYATEKWQEMINLEYGWIRKLHEQLDFANKIFVEFHVRLKIAKRWQTLDKCNVIDKNGY